MAGSSTDGWTKKYSVLLSTFHPRVHPKSIVDKINQYYLNINLVPDVTPP